MSQWETQAQSWGPRFPCPSTLQAQAAFLHPAQPLVITRGAATRHCHPAQGSSGQGLSTWPLGSQKHPRTAAAASQAGSRIVPACHMVAQCCGGGRAEPILETHALIRALAVPRQQGTRAAPAERRCAQRGARGAGARPCWQAWPCL